MNHQATAPLGVAFFLRPPYVPRPILVDCVLIAIAFCFTFGYAFTGFCTSFHWLFCFMKAPVKSRQSQFRSPTSAVWSMGLISLLIIAAVNFFYLEILVIDRTKYMDIDEVKQLRAFTEGWCLRDLRDGRITGVHTWMVVDLALATGLRVSELAAIQIKDIDLKRGFIKVQRRKRNKKVVDSLAISPELTKHLKEYIEWADLTTGALFVGKRGPMTCRGLQQIWGRAIKEAGLPKELSIHSARHSMAVHLLKKTGNLRQVQKQLGHASPATTANMYADISFEDMQNGVTGLYQ